MFNELGFFEILFIAWCVLLVLKGFYIWNYKPKKVKEKQRKCQHEKFIFVKTEYHFTSDLYKVKTNFYECCGCGFIKKDEGFVNED